MLEKIKEIPFIDESSAVRIKTLASGKVTLERNDKVLWGSETVSIEHTAEVDCYVEASKFFNLLPEIKSIEQSTCLVVTLNNNARYELPYIDVSWETQTMPETYADTVNFKLADLMLCTLNNLIKPELQCIYIDTEGAVSCDFVSACISKEVRTTTPFLLPPDVQALVDGRSCKVQIEGDKIYIQASDFNIVTTKPTSGEEPWWEQLRAMVFGPEAVEFKNATTLKDSLKRLSMFNDYISFNGEKVIAGENYEPFNFTDLGNMQYEIEKVNKVLTTTESIAEKEGNLLFKNENSIFLVSPMDEA